ncbi:putative plasmalemma vesicle-associated protein [Scophthalmus maximus]|uniref:Putative plasmalemma vesicle-associated protein n=1 Tax=Scophthalmus maximus TaxID=52904 RepID=A0A2U9C2W4_SCOMX|nr:plasmalemma vesicle associated protein b [Scophthalmus maximus]AWP10718.1 putative plasmalemma vesicle-associated protein [Scophthalmus maximus]
MYSSSYSQAKFGLEAREPLHKTKGKSCGYYMRIVFFFSSLIQSLIIVSLVLFLIYGQPEKSAEERRVEELELNFNRLGENNIALRKEKGELGAQLAARTAEKAALEKDFEKLKTEANNTIFQLRNRLINCERTSATTLSMMTRRPTPPIVAPAVVTSSSELKMLQSLNAQQKAMINLIQTNFTQTVQYLSQERDNALKDRDTHHQDAITLRRENTLLKEQGTTYTKKCKEDFAHSLDGITTVTRDFLNRINSLFPHQLTFHLTCVKQQEQMEKIRHSCTNLSRDVENKFQLYLDNVGNKVAEIQALSSRLEVQNIHLTSDVQQCERSRSEAIAEAAAQLQLKQKTHDDQVEKLLMEQNRLRDEKKLQEDSLVLKDRELKSLQQMLPAQPGFKSGLPKVGGLQAQQDKQTVANWPVGAKGKTLTAR